MPNHTDKRNQFKAAVIATAIALLPLASHAAGLGKITVLSAMGQPLKAELEVSATRDEAPSLVARVAAVDAFRQAGIEYSPALATLQFSRDIKERGGRRYIEVSTDRPLNEPFIDMLVELTWASGRLVREYTFLLDPPDLAAREAPAPVAAPEITSPPAVTKPVEKPEPVVAKDAPPKEAAAPAVAKRPVEKETAKPGNMRTVVAGDTLGKIAAESKPEGVSLDQMLVSLFRGNKDAFIGDNMNRLKAGKILSIPDATEASAVPAGEARKEILAQAADFNAYRKRLAAAAQAAPAKEQVATQTVTGKIAPKVEDKAPPPKGKDKLEVSRTEPAKAAKGAPLQGRVATLEEDLVSRERALKEASSRISDLEKNIRDLKALAELKSQAGADLQKQAQAAKPGAVEAKKPDPAPVVVAAKPAETPKPAEVPKAADASKPVEQPKPAETPKASEPPKAADAGGVAKPPEAPKPKPKPVAPPPEPEPDFIADNMPLLAGGGGVVALLLGWLGFNAYRRKRADAKQTEAPGAELDLSAHSVFSTTVAPPDSEQEPSQFSSTGAGMAAQETVDPIVEAETFLAFGRDAQAEEILLEALRTEPQRQEIHLKLLDIYAARKNPSQFESVARQLHGLTGGSGPGWEKAAVMGLALDPGNTLYGAASSPVQAAPAPAPVDLDATMVLQAAPALATPAAVASPSDAAALDFDLDMLSTPAASGASSTAAPTPASTEAAALDFDLDLGTTPEPSAADSPASAASGKSEAMALDIDFDMPASKEPAAPALDIPLTADKPADMQKTTVVAAKSDSIDFDFDLGTDSAAPPPPSHVATQTVVPAASPAPEMTALNLGDISLELDTPAVASTGASAAEASTDKPDNPEVATKIELAMAYEEMGDRDGARELLQEAVAEGSPAQQKAARAKLDSLA